MQIELLSRGRYEPLPDATARHLDANAWEVRIPRSARAERLLRRWDVDAIDGVTLVIDGVESLQVVGSREDRAALVATALMP